MHLLALPPAKQIRKNYRWPKDSQADFFSRVIKKCSCPEVNEFGLVIDSFEDIENENKKKCQEDSGRPVPQRKSSRLENDP